MKDVFDFLNAFRVIIQIDNYFGGREIIKAENSNIFVISDFMDDEFLSVANILHTKKNIIRWDQNINFINLHLKGVYDYMIGHTEELLRSPKVKKLEALASNTGGEIFNILYLEEIFTLVEH